MGVVISASGSHVTKAVAVAELLKRRLQVSKLIMTSQLHHYDIIVTALVVLAYCKLKIPNTVNSNCCFVEQ